MVCVHTSAETSPYSVIYGVFKRSCQPWTHLMKFTLELREQICGRQKTSEKLRPSSNSRKMRWSLLQTRHCIMLCKMRRLLDPWPALRRHPLTDPRRVRPCAACFSIFPCLAGRTQRKAGVFLRCMLQYSLSFPCLEGPKQGKIFLCCTVFSIFSF